MAAAAPTSQLSKYIVDNGGSADGLVSRRDFEDEVERVRVRLLGADRFTQECQSSDSQRTRDNGLQGLWELSGEDGNERGLLLLPGAVDAVVAALSSPSSSKKAETMGLETLRNLSACAGNLVELARHEGAVRALVHASSSSSLCALQALNNLCCSRKSKLALVRTPHLVSSLVSHCCAPSSSSLAHSRLAHRSLMFLSQDFRCRDGLSLSSSSDDGFVERLLHNGVGEGGVDKAVALYSVLTWTNLRANQQAMPASSMVDSLVDMLVWATERRPKGSSSSFSSLGLGLDDVLVSVRAASELDGNRAQLIGGQARFFPMLLDAIEIALARRDADSLDLALSTILLFALSPEDGSASTTTQAAFFHDSNLLDILSRTVLLEGEGESSSNGGGGGGWPAGVQRTARALRFHLGKSMQQHVPPPPTTTLPSCAQSSSNLVVLSFHPEMRLVAMRVRDELRAKGFAVAYVGGGGGGEGVVARAGGEKQAFSREWEQAVLACRAFWVVYSPKYKESVYCQAEFDFCRRLAKRQMVGLMLEEYAVKLDGWLRGDNKYTSTSDLDLAAAVHRMVNGVARVDDE